MSPINAAIDVVKDYGEYLEYIFESMPMEYTIEEMSYSRWAVSEILRQLDLCPSVPPLITIENFRSKLYDFSLMNQRTIIFSKGCEIVDNVIDMLISS